MNSGALRHLVTLDQPDGYGSSTPLDPPDWYCAVIAEGGAGGTVLVGRYHPGISTRTRVHLKGRIYHVDEVRNRDERDVELVLTAHEVFDA
jgi:hypothetical protein